MSPRCRRRRSHRRNFGNAYPRVIAQANRHHAALFRTYAQLGENITSGIELLIAERGGKLAG
jgi:hypothetical protein